MAMTAEEVLALVGDELRPLWDDQRSRLDRVDNWARWNHDDPHRPHATAATNEYKELIARAQSPWGDLIVSSIAQTLYVEGYRRPDANDDLAAWRIWQANGMDGHQSALHRYGLTYGLAFLTVLPGELLTGESMPTMRGVSPRQMVAVYDDPVDEWPVYAMRVSVSGAKSLRVDVFDNEAVYHLTSDVPEMQTQSRLTLDSVEGHGVGVCPVVRYAHRLDLDGRWVGEVEPIIPLLGRIDQTTFDRLVVQRFASWIVRTIAGMSADASAAANDMTVEQIVARLKVGDFLMSPDVETKFGSLPSTPLNGFIDAKDADVRELASITQSPVHEVLGQMANLSADALAAARASQTAKSDEVKHVYGESHERALRLASWVAGDDDSASDFTAQVRWKDTQIRSLAQAADALGKMAQMLGIPLEMLWERIPGFTDFDVERAKALAMRDDEVMRSLRDLMAAETPAATAVTAVTVPESAAESLVV